MIGLAWVRLPAHAVLGHLHAQADAVQVLRGEGVRVGPQPGGRAVVPLVLDVQHLEAPRRVHRHRVQDHGLGPGARSGRQVEHHVGVHAVDRADAELRLLPVHAVGGLGVADARVGQADAGTDREVVLDVLVPALEQAVGGVPDDVEGAGAKIRRVLPRLIAPHQRVGGMLARGVAPPRDVLDAGDDVVVDEELAGLADFLEGVLVGIRVVHEDGAVQPAARQGSGSRMSSSGKIGRRTRFHGNSKKSGLHRPGRSTMKIRSASGP